MKRLVSLLEAGSIAQAEQMVRMIKMLPLCVPPPHDILLMTEVLPRPMSFGEQGGTIIYFKGTKDIFRFKIN